MYLRRLSVSVAVLCLLMVAQAPALKSAAQDRKPITITIEGRYTLDVWVYPGTEVHGMFASIFGWCDHTGQFSGSVTIDPDPNKCGNHEGVSLWIRVWEPGGNTWDTYYTLPELPGPQMGEQFDVQRQEH